MFTFFALFVDSDARHSVVTSVSLNCGSYTSSDYYKYLGAEMKVKLIIGKSGSHFHSATSALLTRVECLFFGFFINLLRNSTTLFVESAK